MSERRRIYKYLGASGIKTLRTGLLKFSPPSEFNDPFEMQPFLVNVAPEDQVEKEFAERYESLVEDGYRKLPNPIQERATYEQYRAFAEAKKIQTLQHLKGLLHSMAPAMREKFLASINSTLGVFCMTEARDNLLMWAHYADKHRGFVLEFDREHPFFSRKRGPNDEFNQLLPVLYSSARPNDYLANLDVTSVFLTKSEEWRYEREWRILAPLSECTENRDGMHLYAFPPECVTGVILGCKVAQTDENELMEVLKSDQRYAHVVCTRARLDEREFRLQFDPM